MTDPPRPRPRPWWRPRPIRISVRALMVLVLVVGGGLGLVVHRAEVQRDAVAAIERAGGSVKYEREWNTSYGRPNPAIAPSRWLLDRLGPDYFEHVVAVYLTNEAVVTD